MALIVQIWCLCYRHGYRCWLLPDMDNHMIGAVIRFVFGGGLCAQNNVGHGVVLGGEHQIVIECSYWR